MPLQHVLLHSCPQSDIKCHNARTIKPTSSVLACDDDDDDTKRKASNPSLSLLIDNININDAGVSGLTQVEDFRTAAMVTPTPRTPTAPEMMMAGHDMNNKKATDAATESVSPTTRNSKKSRSRASSTSQRATRSASSSTAGTSSRRPGTGTHHRTTSSQFIQQQQSPSGIQSGLQSRSGSITMSPQKRDQLLALHRDSCRLFSNSSNIDQLTLPREQTLHSPFVSPAASPILQSQRSQSFPIGFPVDSDMSDEDLLRSSASSRRQYRINTDTIETVPEKPEQLQQEQPHVPPATVTEWTSPSTRRREYEKIDRSNRGFRRIFRRLTPSCFQSDVNTRTPFFEEGNKKNYEGSVRRFRMDIPDDEVPGDGHNKNHGNDVKFSEKDNKDGLLLSGPKAEKGRWSCF